MALAAADSLAARGNSAHLRALLAVRQRAVASFGGTGGAPSGATGFGGGPGGDSASSALIIYLEAHQGTAKYLVATVSANQAAPIILATGKPVMALGGFLGSDPILTVAQLQSLVREGQIRYFLLGGGPAASAAALAIARWKAG